MHFVAKRNYLRFTRFWGKSYLCKKIDIMQLWLTPGATPWNRPCPLSWRRVGRRAGCLEVLPMTYLYLFSGFTMRQNIYRLGWIGKVSADCKYPSADLFLKTKISFLAGDWPVDFLACHRQLSPLVSYQRKLHQASSNEDNDLKNSTGWPDLTTYQELHHNASGTQWATSGTSSQ